MILSDFKFRSHAHIVASNTCFFGGQMYLELYGRLLSLFFFHVYLRSTNAFAVSFCCCSSLLNYSKWQTVFLSEIHVQACAICGSSFISRALLILNSKQTIYTHTHTLHYKGSLSSPISLSNVHSLPLFLSYVFKALHTEGEFIYGLFCG